MSLRPTTTASAPSTLRPLRFRISGKVLFEVDDDYRVLGAIRTFF